uniref:NADH dehydrogenase subunit 2 n=1 Tax=Aplos simplex TaxID=2837358 RepID=UPI002A7F3592|nr:NADH dehydrogenase subunit 2 [Aplos simplex]WOW98866.1 NADH dehydrogenase subunit 2 [Aplos simplex]
MKLNITKLTMMLIMVTTTIMVMSSNNMLFTWMSMEINLISFMPIMTKSKKMKDQPMKYFIIQSAASSLMIMTVMLYSIIENPLDESIMMMTSLIMKMGLMPFHLWLPSTMQGLTWENCFIISTLQKISPVIFTSQTISMNTMKTPMIMSLIMSPISAIKQLSLKKIMAYSSISNTPWMIMSIKMSKFMFMMFMTIYSITTMMLMKKMKKMNILFYNQMKPSSTKSKMMITSTMLSMSGMPPLTGFFPKWMMLQNMASSSMMLSISMIMSSMLSTFIYLKMSVNMMTTMSTTKSMNKENQMKENDLTFNMLGLPLMMILKTN